MHRIISLNYKSNEDIILDTILLKYKVTSYFSSHYKIQKGKKSRTIRRKIYDFSYFLLFRKKLVLSVRPWKVPAKTMSYLCSTHWTRGATHQNYCIDLNLKRIRKCCNYWHMVALQGMDSYSEVQRGKKEKLLVCKIQGKFKEQVKKSSSWFYQ